MADMMMLVDTAVTVPVNLLPLIDDTDFKSRETAIAYNASGMDLVWNFVTAAGVITQTAVTPTTAGSYDWTHVGDGIYKIEIPASGGASVNNDTEGYGWFSGFVTGVLPWRGPVIQFSPANVVNSLVTGSDKLEVDVAQFGGTNLTASAGRPEVNTTHAAGTAWNSGAITASTLATGALTAAKFATGAFDAVWTVTARLLTAGTNIVLAKGVGVTGLNDLDAAGIRTAVGLASADLDTQIAALPTAAENADAVWDEALSGHATAGTAGKALSDAGSAGDPWSTALPGSYTAGQAGKIIGDNLDAAVSSRASVSALATVDSVADAIKLKTDNLPSDPADASVIAGLIGALPTAAENATAVLTTAMTEAYSTDGSTLTVAQALYEINQMLQEKGTASTTLTVKKRDGSTAAMTFTLDSATAPTSITRAT